jgi:hypothetical protein
MTPNWSEENGDWSISGNDLGVGGTGTQIITCTIEHPDNITSAYVTVDINVATGDSTRGSGIVTNYENLTNYSYALITFDSAGDELTLHTLIGGSDTVVAGPIVIGNEASYSMVVCHVDDVLIAKVPGFSLAAVVTGSEPIVGLIALAASPVTNVFDNFTFFKHKTTNNNCPQCSGGCEACENGVSPTAFKIVIGGSISGDVDCDNTECNGLLGTYIAYETSLDIGIVCDDCKYKTEAYTPSCNDGITDKVTTLGICDLGGGNWKIQVAFGYGGGAFPNIAGINFEETYAEIPDCINLTNEQITNLDTDPGNDCVTTNVTCHITAL